MGRAPSGGAGRGGPGELGGGGEAAPAQVLLQPPYPAPPALAGRCPTRRVGPLVPSSGRWVCSVQGCDTQGGGPPSGRTWGIPHMPPPTPRGAFKAMLWPPGRRSAQGKAGKMAPVMRAHGNWVTI